MMIIIILIELSIIPITIKPDCYFVFLKVATASYCLERQPMHISFYCTVLFLEEDNCDVNVNY